MKPSSTRPELGSLKDLGGCSIRLVSNMVGMG